MTFMNSIVRKGTFGALAGAAMLAGTVAASAATLTGTFTVQAANVTNLNSTQSRATLANFNTAFGGGFGNGVTDTFTYTGSLNFGTSDGSDATTVQQWLDTGGGAISGLEAALGNRQLSKPSISTGDATTTFFSFVMNIVNPVTKFDVRHDDGMTIFDDGTLLGGFQNPTAARDTSVLGFDGGEFRIIYVATNGDPSILEVSAVPLPAGGLLLLTALGGFAAVRRKRKAV